MKRRSFGLLATTSVAALKAGLVHAQAAADPSLLTTTLTPLGSERAGNADGSIPAWTGGYTTVPSGWQTGQPMPDFFADEQPVLTINASNMAQHADRLSEGVMAMMTKYGFSINVYPTHRTACAPQDVYDNIAKNAVNAKLSPRGGRWGFVGAYGGVPFPIPDTSDPLAAGAQIVWNHRNKWWGYAYTETGYIYVVNNGGQPVMSTSYKQYVRLPYYKKGGSAETFNAPAYESYAFLNGPANFNGEQSLNFEFSNPGVQPDEGWEVLAGQGRIRKTPEVSFDTPSVFADGQNNVDEIQTFTGSLERYDWKFIEKKEMYIPYNNNAFALAPVEESLLPHFANPKLVRWELHRCWVVEATLHPGERNVMARRKFYLDEDTYIIGVGDTYDANNNIFHASQNLNLVRPELPGTIIQNTLCYNLQTNNYVATGGPMNEQARPTIVFHDWLPDQYYDPQYMVAASQY